MVKEKINIVWLKRDLRTQDHAAFQAAEQSNLPYLIIFLFEPTLSDYPDTSPRHLQFQFHSVLRMNEKLKHADKEVVIFNEEAINVFTYLSNQFEIKSLFSYQESGTQLTYTRDKTISTFCKLQGIHWKEFQRDGVLRGIRHRKGWEKCWYEAMHTTIVLNSFSKETSIQISNPYPIKTSLRDVLLDFPAQFQPAGEDFAFKYLNSFVSERGRNYSRHISKPLESRTSCARISPYISWGNISVRQAFQFISIASRASRHKKTYANMLTRLHWHCHFIQKFEMECEYETECINAGYELLDHPKKEELIHAWETGNTGFPLVDACMRCLHATGWINFRMRAMLVSFFCHHMYQDWRHGTYHLARLFLDYEPGIHYPQFQMQAGTTGVNTIRMYNPVKQSQEHDPDGIFIKKWVPELANVPSTCIHEPFKMTVFDQQLCGLELGKDYPMNCLELEPAAKFAREKIWGHRSNELVKSEGKRILIKHVKQNRTSQ
jgi:deoxyribodipyrimidine photo-lyase